jgi:hypothetical protein
MTILTLVGLIFIPIGIAALIASKNVIYNKILPIQYQKKLV